MTILSRLGVTTFKHSNSSLFRGLWRGGGPPSELTGGISPTGYISRGIRQPHRANRKVEMKLAPEDFEAPNKHRMGLGLMKGCLFGIGFCGVTFLGVSIWNYESLRARTKLSPWTQWANRQWNTLEGWQHKEGNFRKEVNRLWNTFSEGEKVFWCICFLNVFVYACWHHPALRTTMVKYFCASPAARAVCWPLVLSSFSHFNFLHLVMNMYVLYWSTSPLCFSLGKEQLVGMYLCGGVISGLTSYAYKVATRSPRPSLGASGALMALLSYFCIAFPNSQLSIVFIPGLTFSSDTALKGIACFDAIGMVLRWRIFDHAAHLGGLAFGVLYAYFGPQYIWPLRKPIIKKWHDIRNKFSDKFD